MATSERKCPKCGGVPYLTPSKVRCHDYQCRDCHRKRLKKYTSENSERIAAHQLAKYRAGAKQSRHRPQQPKRDPIKGRAQWAAFQAIRDGLLIRQPCERCGHPKTHAHHDDYGKPLEVRWLCASCHVKHHLKMRKSAV